MTNAVTLASLANSGYLRNRIINGAMQIDQRNAGASGTSANVYTVDRWFYNASQASKGTWQQNRSAVTPPAGFTNYLGFTSSSAYSVLAADYFGLYQSIEGLNIADLAWGTANAKTVTLSFQVYSSLTGTFGGSVANSGFSRSYPFSYTISSANTWTTVSIVVPGDTTGTWLTTNGIGITVNFSLGTGSTFSGAAGAWAGTNYLSVTGATSVVGTNGATFYITGVQLEVGTQATPFEWRPYPIELAMCQRYYQIQPNTEYHVLPAPNATFASTYPVHFPVAMRTTPTLGFSYSTTNAIATYTSAVYSGPRGFVHYISASVSTNAYMAFTYTASSEL